MPHPACQQTPADASASHTPRKGLLLDVFAGVHAPISAAADQRGLARFEAFDLDANPQHNILDDAWFELLLRICWSGSVSLLTLAPPCKEYSRLKLRPGGPKALRTPSCMLGVPNLSPAELSRVRDSREIHRRGAYWWQRTGAFLLKLLHGILGLRPHRAWLFVDDLLAALRRSDADAQLALMVMFFAAISAPISWKKVQFQDSLTWCGWRINFLHETIELTPEKTIKLKGQLHELLKAGKVKRKLLEQVLGLLIWATSLSPELRPWLAPLYTDLRSPPGCMLSVHARLWPSFLSALDAKAVLRSAVRGIFMPPGFQGACVRTPADLPRVVPSHKSAWVRIADASAEHTRLSRMSKHSVERLLQCFHLDLACPLRSKPMLACKAAADACAEGSIVGIGGWFISSNSVAWFGETWQFQEVQEQWPCLTKEAQRYIACFETLAQLALMRIAWSCEGQGVHGICMPTGTDNTALINCSPRLGPYKSLCNLLLPGPISTNGP